MCFRINYMLEWGPLIQEGEVHSLVIRLGKKQLFCTDDTSQLIVIANSAAPPASLAEARGWAAVVVPNHATLGNPKGVPWLRSPRRLAQICFAFEHSCFELDRCAAECSAFFTPVDLLKFYSLPVNWKWLCFLETICLSFGGESVSVVPDQPGNPHWQCKTLNLLWKRGRKKIEPKRLSLWDLKFHRPQKRSSVFKASWIRPPVIT